MYLPISTFFASTSLMKCHPLYDDFFIKFWHFVKFQLETQIQTWMKTSSLWYLFSSCVPNPLSWVWGLGGAKTFEAAYGVLVVVYPGSCYSWAQGLLPLLSSPPSSSPSVPPLLINLTLRSWPLSHDTEGSRWATTHPPAGEPLVCLLLLPVIHFCLRLRCPPGPIF